MEDELALAQRRILATGVAGKMFADGQVSSLNREAEGGSASSSAESGSDVPDAMLLFAGKPTQMPKNSQNVAVDSLLAGVSDVKFQTLQDKRIREQLRETRVTPNFSPLEARWTSVDGQKLTRPAVPAE